MLPSGFRLGRKAVLDLANTPALFFAPFVSSTMRVEPQWIDHNQHLNMAYYNVLMDRAIDELFALIGLGPAYVAGRGGTTFTAECHVMYRRELTADEPVRTTIQLINFDDKRLHTYEELRHANEGWLSATSENISLHVDVATRKVAPFPADIVANLALLKAAHFKLALPESLGRVMGIPRRGATSAPLRVRG
jgi:acyl-CoA thioester hydrolase